jgi:hypothetical protein
MPYLEKELTTRVRCPAQRRADASGAPNEMPWYSFF